MVFRPPSIPQVRIDGIELELNEKLLDFEEFTKEFEAQFHKRLKNVAYDAKEFWKTEAGKKLNTTREGYEKSLGVQDNGDGTYTVTLAGKGGRGTKSERWLALAQEDGIPSFDMKPGLLDGRRIRRVRLADGNYRMVVPEAIGKWIHPGFTGLKIQDLVEQEIRETLVPKYMEEAFNAATKKLAKGKRKK